MWCRWLRSVCGEMPSVRATAADAVPWAKSLEDALLLRRQRRDRRGARAIRSERAQAIRRREHPFDEMLARSADVNVLRDEDDQPRVRPRRSVHERRDADPSTSPVPRPELRIERGECVARECHVAHLAADRCPERATAVQHLGPVHPDNVGVTPAEECCRRGVPDAHDTARIDREGGVGGRLQELNNAGGLGHGTDAATGSRREDYQRKRDAETRRYPRLDRSSSNLRRVELREHFAWRLGGVLFADGAVVGPGAGTVSAERVGTRGGRIAGVSPNDGTAVDLGGRRERTAWIAASDTALRAGPRVLTRAVPVTPPVRAARALHGAPRANRVSGPAATCCSTRRQRRP